MGSELTKDDAEPRYTAAEWRLREELMRDWEKFCDADPVAPDFAERMEVAGFVGLVPVTEEALEETFASERGIYPGGMMWALTDLGRASLAKEGKSDD